jgi:hypothetical protein
MGPRKFSYKIIIFEKKKKIQVLSKKIFANAKILQILLIKYLIASLVQLDLSIPLLASLPYEMPSLLTEAVLWNGRIK